MYNFCDEVENIQRDIDEVDNYLDTIKRLKSSKVNPFGETTILETVEAELNDKKESLKTKWNAAYDLLLDEADCFAQAYSVCD